MKRKLAPEQKFKVGQHVKLLPFEDQPEERATILEYEGCCLYMVELDREFRGKGDDGLRECLDDQIEAL